MLQGEEMVAVEEEEWSTQLAFLPVSLAEVWEEAKVQVEALEVEAEAVEVAAEAMEVKAEAVEVEAEGATAKEAARARAELWW